MSPAARASSKASAWAEAKAPPPTWSDEPVERGGVVRQLVDELPAERGAALDGVAVEVALHGEGHGAPGDGVQQAVVGGVPGLARLALADLDLRPQLPQALDDGRLGAGWHEDEQSAIRGTGHDGGRQRGVPAAGDGQRRGRVGQAEVLRHPQAEHDAHEVAGLVGARHVAGLILDPQATQGVEAQAVVQAGRAHHGRGPEAVPVDRGDGLVQLAHEGHEALVAPAGLASHVIGVQARPIAHERLGVGRGPGVDGRWIEDRTQDVVDVVPRACRRAARRERLLGGCLPAAAGAHEAAGAPSGARRSARGARRRARRPGEGSDARGTWHPSRLSHVQAPTSALKASIMASHSWTMPRVSAQKSRLRRSSNSSMGTPCCSTQV